MNEYTDFGRGRDGCGCGGRYEYGYDDFHCPGRPCEPPCGCRCEQMPTRRCDGCCEAMAIAAIFAVMCMRCR
ncbi:MAG: hypothetical protein MR239_04285 [Clostridiales bacterium]|jgi:hypothetical protein|nr:hypothetical protein [Clostridiales bacterium]MDY4655681.1 hypothetical protein [Eubacteriales bacterium]